MSAALRKAVPWWLSGPALLLFTALLLPADESALAELEAAP